MTAYKLGVGTTALAVALVWSGTGVARNSATAPATAPDQTVTQGAISSDSAPENTPQPMSAGSPPNPAAPAATQSNGIGEIIVTAQRRDESLQRTPVSVSVLTSAALQERAVFSQTDLQRTVPGLTVRATANSNQLNFSIRGQTVDAFSSSTSAVVSYFNEVPISPNSSTPFFDLQSIQVLKGPQGTLFGRNATGGAVLFTSVAPSDKFEGFLTGRYGNYDNKNIEGAVNIPIVDDRVDLRIAGTYQNRDGYAYNLFDDQRVGGVKQYGLRASLLTKITDSLKNVAVLDYDHSSGTNLPNVAYSAYAPGSTNNGVALDGTASALFSPALDAAIGVPGAWAAYLAAHPHADPDGLVAFVQHQRERGPYLVDIDGSLIHRASIWTITNTTSLDLSDQLTIKNIFGYGSSHTLDGQDYDGTSYGIESLGGVGDPDAGYLLKNRTYTDEVQAVGKTADGSLKYVAGFFYSNYRQDQIRDTVSIFDLSPIIPVTLQSIPGITTSKSYAAYAQVTYDLQKLTGIQGLNFVAGGRFTVSKEGLGIVPGNPSFDKAGFQNSLSKTYHRPSYQFGLNYQASHDLLVYAVTRRSFRSGGFNIFAPPRPGDASAGGAAFKPETARDVEVGLKYQGRAGSIPFRFNAAIYSQWVDDIQRTTYADVPGVGLASLAVNVPQARTRGVEVDTQLNPLPWLEIGGDLSFADAKFTKNENVVFGTETLYGPYPDTPKWSGSLFAQASAPVDGRGTKISLRGDIYAQTSFYFSSTAGTISPGTKLPGYALVNLRASLDNIGGSRVSLAGVVRNLTNKVYYVGGVAVGQIISVNSATPGDPRTYYIEASIRF